MREIFTQMKEKINQASEIYISGHIDLDLDAIGSAIGLITLLSIWGKKAYMILDDTHHELAVKQVIDRIHDKIKMIKTSDIIHQDNQLLIVVDTNKKSLLQSNALLNSFPNRMIIDHHQKGDDTIQDALAWIDPYASSTCEMLTEWLDFEQIILPKEINTYLLSGIVLDTNNFVVKTDEKTYYSAYQLTKNGADPTEVQYLLKQDLNEYIARQKVITNVEVHHNIAITKGDETIRYRREDLAKIADTLLQFKGIEASFVIGKFTNSLIGISARSMGDIKVSEVVSCFGGGGDSHDAAARVENKTMDEVEQMILEKIN